MLKQYKNGLFEILKKMAQQEDWDLGRFQGAVGNLAAFDIFTITLSDSPMRFKVFGQASSYEAFKVVCTRIVPGYPDEESSDLLNYKDLQSWFEVWLSHRVKFYLEEEVLPDLWAQIEDYKPIVSGRPVGEEDIQPFNAAEKAQAKQGIQEFRALIEREFAPTPAQMKAIEAKLDYLTEATDRLNHYDWKGLVISTLISISIALNFDSQQGRHLLELFQQVVLATLHYLK